ncbi:MAG: LysR family transcriptional regulator [Massilia sp.]|nr:LysR family transcriptional regulator [Massilia sp.]
MQIFSPTSDELISRPVFHVRRVFCASPQYLERMPVPLDPRELYGHSLGLYSG